MTHRRKTMQKLLLNLGSILRLSDGDENVLQRSKETANSLQALDVHCDALMQKWA